MNKAENIASIYNRYVDDLFTYALYLGFDKESIMDAIHDVFCKLAGDEKKLANISNVKFYLFRSLKNRLYDIYKAQREKVGLAEADVREMPFDINVTIEDRLIDQEKRTLIKTQIEQMLSSLTERQREIIYLRYIQEYDYAQIAELLNISVHGCRKLASKAIKNLREKYAPFVFLLLLF